MKRVILVFLASALTACEKLAPSAVDMQPVGEGLRFLGFSLILAVLLVLIGLFLMKGDE